MQELNDEEVELQVPQKFVDLFESAGSNLMSNLNQETPADFCKAMFKFCFSGEIMSENFDPRNPLVVQALAWLISYHDFLAKQLTSADADYSDSYISSYDLSFMQTDKFYSLLSQAMQSEDEASNELFERAEQLDHSSLVMLNAVEAKLNLLTKRRFVKNTLKLMQLMDNYADQFYIKKERL